MVNTAETGDREESDTRNTESTSPATSAEQFPGGELGRRLIEQLKSLNDNTTICPECQPCLNPREYCTSIATGDTGIASNHSGFFRPHAAARCCFTAVYMYRFLGAISSPLLVHQHTIFSAYESVADHHTDFHHGCMWIHTALATRCHDVHTGETNKPSARG